MFLLIVFIQNSMVGSLKASNNHLFTSNATPFGEMVEQSEGQRKQWWKRVEIILPTLLATAALFGASIAWKHGSFNPRQAEQTKPAKGLKDTEPLASDGER